MTTTSKAQSGLEFLTTYAWIIISVLAIVGMLAYYGYFNPQLFQSDLCDFGTQLRCEEFEFDDTTLNARLTSIFTEPINITNVTGDAISGCTPLNLRPAHTETLTCTGSFAEYNKEPILLAVNFTRADGTQSHIINARIVGRKS